MSKKRKYDFSNKRGQPETNLLAEIARADLSPWELELEESIRQRELGQYEKAKPVESDATLRRLDFFVHQDKIAYHERIVYENNPLVGDPLPKQEGELDLFGQPVSREAHEANISTLAVTAERLPEMSAPDGFVVGLVNGSAGNMRDLSAKERDLPFMPLGDTGTRKNSRLMWQYDVAKPKQPKIAIPSYVYQQGLAVMVDYIMRQ